MSAPTSVGPGYPSFWPHGLPSALRRHSLTGYSLLAFALTWTWQVVAILGFHAGQFAGLVPAAFLGPTLAAFTLTALTSGKSGVLDLLRRYVLWRVSSGWYLAVLTGMAFLFLLSAIVQPGASAAFRPPTLAFVSSYLGLYAWIFVTGGPLGEEPGWRGFALPRLEQHAGALGGTLALGVIHALWHLPLFLLLPGYNGAGTGLLGIGVPFLQFAIGVAATTVLFTWVFNNVRGSLLLAMLLHASVNTGGSLVFQLSPSLAMDPRLQLTHTALLVVAALLIGVATRGRLSYERYQREVGRSPALSRRSSGQSSTRELGI